MDRRPVIGVSGADKGGLSAWLFTWLALRRAGAKAVRVTPRKTIPVERLDGLILGGGADVDPTLYDAALPRLSLEPLVATPASWRRRVMRWLSVFFYPLLFLLRKLTSKKRVDQLDRDRDELEMRLLQQACLKGLPTLGICRGAQLLNVYFGGSLHQDISGFYTETPNVRSIRPRKRVRVAAGSLLAEILQTKSCPVNALHRQAIKNIGHGLRVALNGPRLSEAGLASVAAIPGLDELELLGANSVDVTTEEIEGLSPPAVGVSDGPPMTDSDVALLGRLPNLKAVRLERLLRIGGGDLTRLESAKSLRALRLTGAQFDDESLHSAATWPPLERLSLANSAVTDKGLIHLRHLSQLRELDLAGTHITDEGLAHLRALPRLETLVLRSTTVSDAGLVHLRGMSSLRSLDLSFTQIWDRGLVELASLPRLEAVDLSYNEVWDESLVHLAPLTALKQVSLVRTMVGDEGLAHLSGLTELRVLLLGRTQVGDEGLARLVNLRQLETLDLNKTHVTDSGLARLRTFANLRRLGLVRTRVTDRGLSMLLPLTNLETLFLDRARVTDAGIWPLAGLPRLRTLTLYGTWVTEPGMEVFQTLAPRVNVTFR